MPPSFTIAGSVTFGYKTRTSIGRLLLSQITTNR